jgi:hypothetical protein
MVSTGAKYLYIKLLNPLLVIIVTTCCSLRVEAQNKVAAKDSSTQQRLVYYHRFTNSKPIHPYTKIDYTRPNNQLMSWPNFPLTATEIERRHRVSEQENKPGAVIAKDIITNLLRKKTKVAVIPTF